MKFTFFQMQYFIVIAFVVVVAVPLFSSHKA